MDAPHEPQKNETAEIWCRKMSGSMYGEWRHLFVPQQDFEKAIRVGVKTLDVLARRLHALGTFHFAHHRLAFLDSARFIWIL